jgi:hypothetical protein
LGRPVRSAAREKLPDSITRAKRMRSLASMLVSQIWNDDIRFCAFRASFGATKMA